MQRELRKTAEKERKRRRRTWIRYGKIQIDDGGRDDMMDTSHDGSRDDRREERERE